MFSIINSKNSFVLPNEFILNRYSIINNLQHFFDLLIYAMLMHSSNYDKIKCSQIMIENSQVFEEILLDLIILFENEIAYKKTISFKTISSKDLNFITSNLDFFKSLKKELQLIGKQYTNNPFFNAFIIKKKSKFSETLIDINDDIKYLIEANDHISQNVIDGYLVLIKIFKYILKISSHDRSSKQLVIDKLIDWFDLNNLDLNSKNEVAKEINMIRFLLFKKNLSAALAQVLSLLMKLYKNTVHKFKIFVNALHMFKPPYNLMNIDISSDIMIVNDTYKNVLYNHTKWYRTMIISNNPLVLIKLCQNKWIKTNATPNNTFDIFSLKKGKINNLLSDENCPQINVLKKLNATSFKIDKNHLNNISLIIKSLEITGFNTFSEKNQNPNDFISFLNSEEIRIFKNFIFLVNEYSINDVYLPWYFDSRMRIYSYSVFAPTAGRIMRGILNIQYEGYSDGYSCDKTKNIKDFFINLRDEDFELFFDKLYVLDAELFKFLVPLQTRSEKEKINLKVFLIAIANRYWNNNILFCKEPTHNDLLNNLILKIKNDEFKIINFIQLFSKNERSYHLGSYNKFFMNLFSDQKSSKSDSFEELLILSNFAKMLFTKEIFFVQFDVSASALALCGLILGYKNSRLLNISDNNFIKNDAYEILADNLKSSLGISPQDDRFNRLINRKLLKKPAMTIMYGSGEKLTVSGIVNYLQIWDINNNFSAKDKVDSATTRTNGNHLMFQILAARIYKFLIVNYYETHETSKINKDYLLENNDQKCDDKALFDDNKDDLDMNQEFYLKRLKTQGILYENLRLYLDIQVRENGDNGETNPHQNITTHDVHLKKSLQNPESFIKYNALEKLFYEKSLNTFRDMAVENLLIYGGVIWINNEPSILAYTSKTTRMFSTMSTKHDEFLKANYTVYNQISFDNINTSNDILAKNTFWTIICEIKWLKILFD